MSLLLVSTEADKVVTLSDAITYAHTGEVGWCQRPKSMPLPMYSAVLSMVGQAWVGDVLYDSLTQPDVVAEGIDFDVLADCLPDLVSTAWEGMNATMPDIPHAMVRVHLSGWSRQRQRFVTVSCRSDDGFVPERREDGLMIYPLPSEATQATLTYPETPAEWIAVAEAVRRDHINSTVEHGAAVLIGGHALMTTLDRSGCRQEVIHTFDNSPELWDRYLPEGFDPPPPFPDQPSMAKVGRNDPCICGSGQKSKRCCGLPAR